MNYSDIGVRPFINCCGTRTIHSGTLMLPCVRAAMMDAANVFVNMDELMAGVGRRIAELTGAEHAILTSGGAASLCVATAAAVTLGDPERIQRLPLLDGVRDRVVMLKSGRFTYDQAIRAVGVTIVEVETEGELDGAVDDERTAMVALLGTDNRGLSVREVADVVDGRVPILVDAASEHLRRPNPHLEAGATMVAYSGGKYLRGPQCTGLLIGEARWVRAAWTNAAPHHTFARMMKVGKEEVMGLLAAVEFWAGERDDAADYDRMIAQLEEISGAVTQVDRVSTEVFERRADPSPSPRLEITWPAGRIHGLELREALLEGTPRIMLDDRGATEKSVFILPFSLQPGEAPIVGARIAQVLSAAGRVERDRLGPGEPATVDGQWDVRVSAHAGEVAHRLTLAQSGNDVSGRHEMRTLAADVVGRVDGDRVELTAEHPVEGTRLVYRVEGRVSGSKMSGRVEIGTEGQSAPGPLNRREYGAYDWRGGMEREDVKA